LHFYTDDSSLPCSVRVPPTCEACCTVSSILPRSLRGRAVLELPRTLQLEPDPAVGGGGLRLRSRTALAGGFHLCLSARAGARWRGAGLVRRLRVRHASIR